ncbi:hypothetical protein C2845_PM09G22550 [Panicum miliaceum]|uniref:Uncharacterized protein n=1 Tax=Panicum miliaceum TaxID=4540 RepID=A0A3L6S1Y4_PANMI|nr:hypothetical protein C2845_PM09G22550 [Panicum miliaceum]
MAAPAGEHSTARAEAAALAAAPETGAGVGGTPASIFCTDAAANSMAATATSSTAARDAIASASRPKHEAEVVRSRGDACGRGGAHGVVVLEQDEERATQCGGGRAVASRARGAAAHEPAETGMLAADGKLNTGAHMEVLQPLLWGRGLRAALLGNGRIGWPRKNLSWEGPALAAGTGGEAQTRPAEGRRWRLAVLCRKKGNAKNHSLMDGLSLMATWKSRLRA